MTAITARLNSSTFDPAYLRGLAIGALATLILVAAFVALALAATWKPTAGTTPTTIQPPAQQVVDESHPIVRPGGLKVF